MKEKVTKKLRFNVQQLDKVEEKPSKPPEHKRKKRLASIGDKLIEERKKAAVASHDRKLVNKPPQKSRRHSSSEQKTTPKPTVNQNERDTRGNQIPPFKTPDRTSEKSSPTKSSASNRSTPVRASSENDSSKRWQMVKSRGQKDLSKGWNLLMGPPARTASYEDQYPPVPTDEDPLSYPFGGARKLSDSNLMAAHPATNIIYLINQSRKKRLKETINNEIAAINDRVRKALEHADIYEEDPENKEEQDGSESKTGFDTRSKREIMKFRNELIYTLREHIEDCHQRMVLMTDVNKWIQAQQKELEEDLVSEEELEEEEFQNTLGHKKIIYSLEALTNCTKRISDVGKKLIEVSRRLIKSSNKGKVEKIHIIDEKTMLTNKAKWDQAIASIIMVFDDAQKWVKAAPIKAALRNGKKQYQVILIAVEKRLSELAEMSALAEDLQNKLMMSKEMINSYSKEAEESRRMVDRLGKELKAMQSQLSLTMETNAKLTGQLQEMEGQVKEMKEELSKPPPPPPPPRPPTPPRTPTPPPPRESESAQLLMAKTMEQVSLLQQEIGNYRMIVHNLSTRIDELEELLEKEQKRVEFLKESLETRQAPVIQERPPEPTVEIPALAPPPEMTSDTSAGYYKTLLTGMKKDFLVEVDKLKDHLKKEQNRNDANIRRIEQGHKDQIQGILKDCMRVLRAIVHFRDQVAIALEKEGYGDPARQLQQLPKLAQENVGQDPKDVLLYMAGNVVDYLHSMEVVMNHTLLAMKVMQKSGGVGNNPPVSQAQVYKQMEERMEEISQPSTIRKAVRSPVKRVSGSRRKDKQNIKRLQGMATQFENKYVGLLDRYKLVWKMYSEQKQEMDGLHTEFDQTIKRKVKEKEHMVVSAIQTELKERRANNEHQLQMSIADQRKNLALLDRALDDNKISRELHQMATGLLKQAMDIPRKRFRYIIERYIAHRAVKEAKAKSTTVLREEKMASSQRSDLLLYMDQMQNKLEKGLSVHHRNMERLEAERRNIFTEIWTLFNEVLLDTGVLLIQPVFLQTKGLQAPRPRTKSRLLKHKKKAVCRKDLLGMPIGLVGSNMPLSMKIEKRMWRPAEPAEVLSPQPAITTPLFLDMDINRQRLLAKRKLQIKARRVYPLSQSRSYTICNEISVDFIAKSVKPPSMFTPPIK